MLFRTQYNFVLGNSETDVTTITEPSQTVPDESLTIREIFERYATGRPLDVVDSRGIYTEDKVGKDPDFDDYDDLCDPNADISDFHAQAAYEYAYMLDEEKRKKDSAKKKRQEEFDKRVKEEAQRMMNDNSQSSDDAKVES
ncbi:hypothetical protein [Tortoise microvirus 33]|nr:hypothetical protein [Tortoise microvirus 33]